MKVLNVLLLVSLLHCLGTAQERNQYQDEAWEPEEERSNAISSKLNQQTFFSFFTFAGSNLISFYQTNISPNSISRCPFKISCSRFAQQAIKHYNLFGVCIFIDRYFYRENNEIYAHYKLVEIDNGALKLDDTFFLAQ